jgi:hypothetical protein
MNLRAWTLLLRRGKLGYRLEHEDTALPERIFPTTMLIKQLSYLLLLSVLSSAAMHAATQTAASCATSDVQTAINSAAEGDTVVIPSCPSGVGWSSGVRIAGKGITIQGQGSGRIIAYDNGIENLTVGTGTLTINIAGYSPGFNASSITNGETLRVSENNNRTNWMEGTVTALSGNTLTMNITSTGGSGTTHRWLVSTIPSTVIVNNSSSGALFVIAEDTTVNTNWNGIKIAYGTGTSSAITPLYSSGGQAILIHDCWIEHGLNSGENIDSTTNRGVIWNCSFDGSSGNSGQLVNSSAFRIKGAPATSWTTAATWGAADTTGQGNFYVETNDFHAFQAASDIDDNARAVWRYNLMDNAEFSTHGPDTSNYGERYFEYYNNTGVFNGYSDGTTFNLPNGWVGIVRGGTFVVHDNTLPPIQSQDYGTKPDVEMALFNLHQNAGPNPCWGAGTTGGACYHVPRQVGYGYVTGTGTSPNTSAVGCISPETHDSITYVGDSEPAYIWANSRQPLPNITLEDFAPNGCTNPDTVTNYIIAGRDFFNGSTAKPGYTPYTYPHPLTQGQGAPPPTPPQNLQAIVE